MCTNAYTLAYMHTHVCTHTYTEGGVAVLSVIHKDS